MKVVVLTGAGISAESGVPTFRDADGLWEGHRVEDVATPEAYDLQPARRPPVLRRPPGRPRRGRAEPRPPRAGAARGASRRRPAGRHPEHRRPARARRIRPGSLHMHGELRSALCRACRTPDAVDRRPRRLPALPAVRGQRAAAGRRLVRRDALRDGPDLRGPRRGRPVRGDRHVGRGLPGRRLRPVRRRRRRPDARAQPAPSEVTGCFDESRQGPAGELVPAWVDELLAGEL